MKPILFAAFGLACSWSATACDSSSPDNRYQYAFSTLIPGPAEDGYDQDLEMIARIRDRQYHAFHAVANGTNTEIDVTEDQTVLQAIEDFLFDHDGWDFEEFSGLSVRDAIGNWRKVAGMYGGAGVAADAYRYGTLRDQNYPKQEVEHARDLLLTSLDALHRAMAITGEEGVIARGYASKTYPGNFQQIETTPLFDHNGDPLPPEKDNGTWREDTTGLYPDFVWEDSCSRDMLVGWMIGWGAAWEVIRDDENINQEYRERMRTDALTLAGNLMTVRENGYDLELLDADGRTTYHGYLNENALDRAYIDGVNNGFHTIMALGVISTLATIADDSGINSYLYQELLRARKFAEIARDNMLTVYMGLTSNFSNYNMAVDGVWLASRFLRDPQAREDVESAMELQIYNIPGEDRQPIEMGQTWFDLVYAATMCGASSDSGCTRELDQSAIDRGLQTLKEIPEPPFIANERISCDQQEIDAGVCIADDGVSQFTLLGYQGWNNNLITKEIVPMRLRPPSNYFWRSNPYTLNGGPQTPMMIPGVDFRLAYWTGRWVRR